MEEEGLFKANAVEDPERDRATQAEEKGRGGDWHSLTTNEERRSGSITRRRTTLPQKGYKRGHVARARVARRRRRAAVALPLRSDIGRKGF